MFARLFDLAHEASWRTHEGTATWAEVSHVQLQNRLAQLAEAEHLPHQTPPDAAAHKATIPPNYRAAMEAVRQAVRPAAHPLISRLISLELARAALNGDVLRRFTDVSDVTVTALSDYLRAEAPDARHRRLCEWLLREPHHCAQMAAMVTEFIDIVAPVRPGESAAKNDLWRIVNNPVNSKQALRHMSSLVWRYLHAFRPKDIWIHTEVGLETDARDFRSGWNRGLRTWRRWRPMKRFSFDAKGQYGDLFELADLVEHALMQRPAAAGFRPVDVEHAIRALERPDDRELFIAFEPPDPSSAVDRDADVWMYAARWNPAQPTVDFVGGVRASLTRSALARCRDSLQGVRKKQRGITCVRLLDEGEMLLAWARPDHRLDADLCIYVAQRCSAASMATLVHDLLGKSALYCYEIGVPSVSSGRFVVFQPIGGGEVFLAFLGLQGAHHLGRLLHRDVRNEPVVDPDKRAIWILQKPADRVDGGQLTRVLAVARRWLGVLDAKLVTT